MAGGVDGQRRHELGEPVEEEAAPVGECGEGREVSLEASNEVENTAVQPSLPTRAALTVSASTSVTGPSATIGRRRPSGTAVTHVTTAPTAQTSIAGSKPITSGGVAVPST